jgi:hypothetical protein
MGVFANLSDLGMAYVDGLRNELRGMSSAAKVSVVKINAART